MVLCNGLGVFWPAGRGRSHLDRRRTILGERIRSQTNPDTGQRSTQFKTGNREQDPQRQDFRWVPDDTIRAITIRRRSACWNGWRTANFYGP